VTDNDSIPQICLAGRTVSNDWPLIQALKGRHAVTLVDRVEGLASAPLLAAVRVLVLDAAGSGGAALRLLPAIRDNHPVVCVLLVDGGLDQRQLARAFREGTRDYFPAPYDVHLLAERVRTLCLRPRPRRRGEVRRGR
jgi:DNA-binding NtrC family response regulator